MDQTLRIKITLTDGRVFEIEQPLAIAQKFLLAVPQEGYHDRATARFYAADAIRTIEVMPPPAPIEFSEN
jgi:hypothetical protein